MKTSDNQKKAYSNWRSKMIAKGYVWKSAFVPANRLDELNAIIAKWKVEHEDS